MNDVNREKELKDKYAKMFIAMSTDYLMGGITWETFVLGYFNTTKQAAEIYNEAAVKCFKDFSVTNSF